MAIRQGNYKLVANKDHEEYPPMLLDLSSEINEEINIENEEKETYDSLMSHWESWNTQMKDRIFPTLGEDVWWNN